MVPRDTEGRPCLGGIVRSCVSDFRPTTSLPRQLPTACCGEENWNDKSLCVPQPSRAFQGRTWECDFALEEQFQVLNPVLQLLPKRASKKAKIISTHRQMYSAERKNFKMSCSVFCFHYALDTPISTVGASAESRQTSEISKVTTLSQRDFLEKKGKKGILFHPQKYDFRQKCLSFEIHLW